ISALLSGLVKKELISPTVQSTPTLEMQRLMPRIPVRTKFAARTVVARYSLGHAFDASILIRVPCTTPRAFYLQEVAVDVRQSITISQSLGKILHID
nr:hypothetical protein [Tanacetum cinerariifolium]